MISRLEELKHKKTELEMALNDINNEIKEIEDRPIVNLEQQYNISRYDSDRKCKRLCSKCIIPCENCFNNICEQCRYGYKNIPGKLFDKYGKDIIKHRECPYAMITSFIYKKFIE